MEQKDKKETVRRYAERLGRLGPTVQALGWRDEEQQCLRFEVLTEIDELDGKSVLDVGCGFGDFYTFLKALKKQVDYSGVDISQEVLCAARRRHPDIQFDQLDLIEDRHNGCYDYVVESGIFNHRIGDNEEFVQNMLSAMYDCCQLGIAANMMSTYVDYQDDHLYYYNPAKIMDFAKKLSRFVSIRHDYPLYEFTLFIYKENRFSN